MSTESVIIRVSPLVEARLVEPLSDKRRLADGIWLLNGLRPSSSTWPRLDVMADDLMQVIDEVRFPVPPPDGLLARHLDEAVSGQATVVALSRGLRPAAAALRAELSWPCPDLSLNQEPWDEICVLGHGEAWVCRPVRAWERDPLNIRTVRQITSARISRAEVKWQQARACLQWLIDEWPQGPWLDLGAAPGGMTRLLAQERGAVTALDLGELDLEVANLAGVTAIVADALTWEPADDTRYAGLVCDMNGPPELAVAAVERAADWLLEGAPVMLTLKAPGWDAIEGLSRAAGERLKAVGIEPLRHQRFISHRRHETALLGCRRPAPRVHHGG